MINYSEVKTKLGFELAKDVLGDQSMSVSNSGAAESESFTFHSESIKPLKLYIKDYDMFQEDFQITDGSESKSAVTEQGVNMGVNA